MVFGRGQKETLSQRTTTDMKVDDDDVFFSVFLEVGLLEPPAERRPTEEIYNHLH